MMTREEAIALNNRLAKRLPPAPLYILSILIQYPGQTVPYERISKRMFDMSSDYPTREAITSAVKILRRIPGIKIKCDYCFGYRMVTPPEMKA